MKKFYASFVAVLSAVSLCATAQTRFYDVAAYKPVAALSQTTGSLAAGSRLAPDKLSRVEHQGATIAPERHRSRSAAASMADLPQTPLQLDYGQDDAYLSAAAVSLTLSDNTLTISNFAGLGQTLTATLDPATGAVSIPRQSVYVSATYGNCDIIHVNDGYTSVDTVAAITGVLADGVITLDHWAMYITSGDYAGYILGDIRDRSVIEDANATMNVVQLSYDEEGNQTGSEEHSYPVIVSQTATNEVEVVNFLGLGYRYLIGIKGDHTLTITPQQLFSNSSYGVFYLYPFDPETGLTTINGTIRGSTDDNRLSWGGCAVHTSNGKYYAARYQSCDIALPFALQYPPVQTQAGFKGSGTAADPWLIETLADLLALSDSVNYGTTTDPTGKYVKMYEGRYFKQTRPINAKGYNFPPIGGSDDLYRFAGTYDGDDKTISNLTISTGQNGYAGLFGSVDTCGVIKNVTVSNPVVECSYYFAGAIAGNCNGTMDNCKATNGSIKGQYTVGGLAGKVGPAVHCSFSGNVQAEAQCGGVFGVSRHPVSFISATATNVMITSTTSQAPVGGLLGQMSSDYGGSISDSYFSGNIYLTRTTQFAGGIVGTTSRNTVSRCLSLAQIGMLGSTVGATVAGGIVGGNIATDITDCHFAGENCVGSSRSGAIVGYTLNIVYADFPDSINISNCYVTGLVTGTTKADYYPYVGYYDPQGGGKRPTIASCYYDAQMLPLVTSKNGALCTSEMTGTDSKMALSTDVWTLTDHLYPRLTSIAQNAASYVAAAPIALADTAQTVESVTSNFTLAIDNGVKWYASRGGQNGTEGYTLDIEQSTGEVLLNGRVGVDTLLAQSGSVAKYLFVRVVPANQFEGSGTEDDLFLIRNKEELIKLSTITFDNKMSYTGVHFKITADIDVEHDAAFKGIAPNGSVSGYSTYAFGGILDGDNHTIHNVRMVTCELDAEGKTTASVSNCGFVNNLKAGGVVKNLRMAADCHFEFFSRSAALVGYNNGGRIENCRNYARVTGHSGNVASMTGYNADGGVISGCYNVGKIVGGYQYVGGICATNRGLIDNCQNDGEVAIEHINEQYAATRGNTAGGICHANFGTVSNVLNTGYIHAPKYVGGIMAWFNNKEKQIADKAVNIGIVDFDHTTGPTEEGTIGNIVGKMYQVGTMTACYYDGQLSLHEAAHGTAHDGASALTTAQLTSGSAPQDLLTTADGSGDTDGACWLFEPGRYPMLKTFADEPAAQAAAAAVAFFADNARADSIKHDVVLNTAEGLTWTMLKGGRAFAVRDNSLLWMDPADELADTLVAASAAYVKCIPVAAVPDTVPAPGLTQGKGVITFTNDLDEVVFYYTLDGSDPTTESDSTTGDVELADGSYVVKVMATRHNYYPSVVVAFDLVTSGIADAQALTPVLSVQYYNADGAVADRPFRGVNVRVTTYIDGTRRTAKVVY